MKKLLSSIVLIFAFSTLYAQNYRAYSIEALYKLESLRAFVLGGDTVFNTTKLSPMDTILVTLEYLKDYAGGGGLPPITGDDIGKSLMVANDTTAKWLFNNDAIFKTGEHVSNLGIVKATVEERLQLNSTPMVNKIHTYNLASGVTFPVVIHAETAQNAPNGYSGDFTITAANNTFANGVDATISHSYKLYMPDANTLKMQWVTGQEIYDGYWGDKMWFRLTESGQAQQLTSKSYVDLEPKGVARAYTKPDTLIIKLRDSTLVKTYLQTGGGGGTMNHAELSNLGYGVSGHTGFAGTAVENTFTQNQKIEKATPDLILNSTSGNARIEFQHNGNAGGLINGLSDGRLEIRSASDKYINLYNTFRWPVIPSPLVTPELKGMTYFNSNLNQFLGYDGTRWVNLGDTVFGGKFQLYTDTLTWDATKYNLSFYEPKLPDPPTTTPDRYFLNANKVWATVPTGAGAGYLGNMYFTPEPSDVAGYFNLNSTPPIDETEKAATASNGEVLVASYIRQTPIGVSVIDGGEWGGVIRFKLSGNQGVSRMRIEIYIRSQNGTENVLFSQLTDELNSTVYVYNPASFQKPSFTVDPDGRLGVKVYFTTTATNITLTYMEGGSFASFITTPIRIRHSELRDWNIDPAYQHVTQTMKDSIEDDLYSKPQNTIDVNQPNHGLSVGDAIYLNGSNYEKAIATDAIQAAVVGIVVQVQNINQFTYAFAGIIGNGYVPAMPYFLSTTTKGYIGAEPSYSPGQVRQFIGTGTETGKLLLEIDIGLKISAPAISGEVGGGTITSVSGTGSVNGITLTGTVTSSGTITLGGVLSGIENSQLANSSITINEISTPLGGSTTITPTMIGALQADYPSSLSINQTYLGNTISGTAGEDLAFGDFVYYKWADKKWWKASASAYATARTRGVIVEAITAESTGKVLIDGFVRNDTWAWSAAEVWLSITAGAGTSTQPSETGNQIQFLGTAINETHLLFKPSQDIGEK